MSNATQPRNCLKCRHLMDIHGENGVCRYEDARGKLCSCGRLQSNKSQEVNNGI
jgi:hypothetical protein